MQYTKLWMDVLKIRDVSILYLRCGNGEGRSSTHVGKEAVSILYLRCLMISKSSSGVGFSFQFSI